MKQAYLIEMINDQPEISVTYFLPDIKKSGGAYVTVTGKLKHFNEYESLLILTDSKKIPMDDIADIECESLQRNNLIVACHATKPNTIFLII